MRFRALPLLILLLALLPAADAPDRACSVVIVNQLNERVSLRAEIADTEEKRNRGLMFRTALGVGEGMIFIFEENGFLNFWMKNTYIPLSIAYINEYGIINEIYDMKPRDASLVASRMQARYALEVNRGWFRKNRISRGCRITLDGCLRK